MSDNTDLGITVDAWAKIVIERWERNMVQRKIGKTGTLLRSFHHYINSQANGNPQMITFAFEYYGRFVDMGVGGGESIFGKRKPKRWYSKTFWSQFMFLKDLLAEKYAMKGQMEIISEFTGAEE